MKSIKLKVKSVDAISPCGCELDYREETASSIVNSVESKSLLSVISNKLGLSYAVYQK